MDKKKSDLIFEFLEKSVQLRSHALNEMVDSSDVEEAKACSEIILNLSRAINETIETFDLIEPQFDD